MLERLPDGVERLLVGQKSGVVYGLDPAARRRVVWQARVGTGGINGGIVWGLASDGRNVYAAVSDLARRARADATPFDWRPTRRRSSSGGGLTALDIRSGTKTWLAPPAPCPPRSPSAAPRSPPP